MTISRRYTTIIGTRDFLKLYTPDALVAWPLSVVVLVLFGEIFQSRIICTSNTTLLDLTKIDFQDYAITFEQFKVPASSSIEIS